MVVIDLVPFMVVAVVGDDGACFCCARLLVGCLLLFWFNAVGLLLLFLVRVCWCCVAVKVSVCFGVVSSCISAVFLLVLC